jgi:two-component system OmpR family sensor kinase/two-component system sensor histidine kinase BaeS
MRPRIFTLMLLAFALVIVLGIGGMTSFFWIAAASVERRSAEWTSQELALARSAAERLGAYYAERGSWAGVASRFAAVERELDARFDVTLTLTDAAGNVVASSRSRRVVLPSPRAGGPDGPGAEVWQQDNPWRSVQMAFQQALPVTAEGQVVGALLVQVDGQALSDFDPTLDRARFGRGILSAGLALTAILLGLAAIFSGRISRPLRRLNRAAEAMAAGDLKARVQPPMLRELADLSLSFNRMADALEAADQQRRQLTADVAHELRTPLSIIKGRLEGVQDGVYRPDAEQIEGLLDEVALLERLIEDLRLLALADAGQLALFPEPVDPAHLVDDAQRSFAQQAAERGVQIRTEVAPGLPELNADPQRIAQVLGNLAANALRHTPAGGEVVIAAALSEASAPGERAEAQAGEPAQNAPSLRSGGTLSPQPTACVLFSVRDTGTGIAAADLPHIFDRFYRADRSRTRGSGGAGLGLAIARRIVEAHGGTIDATSTPGKGTTVSFRLPVG